METTPKNQLSAITPSQAEAQVQLSAGRLLPLQVLIVLTSLQVYLPYKLKPSNLESIEFNLYHSTTLVYVFINLEFYANLFPIYCFYVTQISKSCFHPQFDWFYLSENVINPQFGQMILNLKRDYFFTDNFGLTEKKNNHNDKLTLSCIPLYSDY